MSRWLFILGIAVGCADPAPEKGAEDGGGDPADPADTGVPTDTGGEDYTPESWPDAAAPATSAVWAEGLDRPYGLAPDGDGWWVVEAGAGRLVRVQDGEITPVADGLTDATLLAVHGGQALVGGAESVWSVDLDDGGVTLLADGLEDVTALALGGDGQVAVAASTGLWTGAGDALSLADATVVGARGLAFVDELLWVADTDGMAVVAYDDAGDEADRLSLDEAPWSLAFDGDALFVACRSLQWPYGGWVYGGTADGLAPLSSSPPEATHLQLAATDLVWSSKQTITVAPRAGGTYRVAAVRTAVGGLVVVDDQIVWTDRERGLLLQAPVAGEGAIDPEG